jgi:hypothetical protein
MKTVDIMNKRQMAEKIIEKHMNSKTCTLSNISKPIQEYAINKFMSLPESVLIHCLNQQASIV